MKAENKNGKAGVTFLEVMITIAVIGILSGIGIVSLSSSQNQAKLKNAQTEVAAAIKLAQSYALQGKKCPNGDMPVSYRFNIKSASSYGIKCNNTQDVEDDALSGGVTFSTSVGSFVSFDVPHANKSGLSSIAFMLSGAGRTIEINDWGGITIN